MDNMRTFLKCHDQRLPYDTCPLGQVSCCTRNGIQNRDSRMGNIVCVSLYFCAFLYIFVPIAMQFDRKKDFHCALQIDTTRTPVSKGSLFRLGYIAFFRIKH